MNPGNRNNLRVPIVSIRHLAATGVQLDWDAILIGLELEMTTEEAIDFYDEAHMQRVQFVGGYGVDIEQLYGVVAIASFDTSGGVSLEMFRADDFTDIVSAAANAYEAKPADYDDAFEAIMNFMHENTDEED